MTTTNSTIVANSVASPRVVNAKHIRGAVHAIVDTIEVPDTADNDICILAKLPADAVVLSLQVASDDLGSAGTVDVGFFKKNADDSFTVIDANNIASGLDMNTAAVAFTERRHTVANIDAVCKTVWEWAGLSARPDYNEIFIGLTTTTGTTAVGTVSIKSFYIA